MKNKIKKNPVTKFIFKYNKPKIEKNKKKEFKNNWGDRSRLFILGYFIYA